MLLEREAAQAALADYAREASNGSGRLVLVSGEAGVGKSALVDQLRQTLPAARWSWGACDGLFTPRPLGPLFDLAGQLGGELARLCQAGAGRDELFRALLQQLSGPGPLQLVIIEDVHWADESTVDLLRYLGRRLRDAAVLLVVTYRDDGLTATDPLRIALGDLATQRPIRRISLGPLSRDAVGVLAAGSGLEPAGLYELTGGNPFYVTEVLAAGMSEIPTSARDAVLARAARLTAGTREVLDVAALTGTRVELPLLTAVTGCPPPVLDELLASGLLTADDGGLRFRHEIARLAVAQAVPAHRRTETHGRILAALRASGSTDDARLAFHAEAAGDAAAVLEYAPRAGRRAARLAAHREAAEQFARALRVADTDDADGTGPALAAGLYGELAWEVSLADRWEEAEQATRRALELWRTVGDRRREGDSTRLLSIAAWHLTRGAEATALAEQAIAILEPLGATPELVRAYVHLAGQRMLDYDHGQVTAMARQAERLAEEFGLPDVLSDALNTQACVASNTGGGTWAGQLERALQIAVDAGQEAQAGRAYINLYSIYCGQRRFAEAEPYYTEGVAYCDDHDIPTFSIFLHSERASALEKTGRWDEAVDAAADLLRRGGPSPVIRLCPLNRIGPIRARRGEPGAWEYLDEAMAAADGTAEAQNVVPVRLTRAEACWLEGRTDDARREAELADDSCANCDGWARGAVAAWLRRTGSGRPPRGELAGPYQAELAGDWAAAAQQWQDLGCPYDAALALLDAPDEAALRTALDLLTVLGAEATAQIARHRLRSRGVRSIPVGPRAATRADPLRLTQREREVLGLICAGLSNAEIAAQLFISVRTAGHHVSAILAKLDAPTRHAAAIRAAELGLTGVPAAR